MGVVEDTKKALDPAARRAAFTLDRLADCLATGDIAAILAAFDGEEPDWKKVFIEWFESRSEFEPGCWLSLLLMHACLTPFPFEANGEA